MSDYDVKKLRLKLHYSQKELAELLAVDPLTVSRWERKLQRPRPLHIRKLMRLESNGEVS